MRLFLKDVDFEAFERIIEKTLQSQPMRICAYCLLTNHWHCVLWPKRDGDLGAFLQKLTRSVGENDGGEVRSDVHPAISWSTQEESIPSD